MLTIAGRRSAVTMGAALLSETSVLSTCDKALAMIPAFNGKPGRLLRSWLVAVGLSL